jgi:hypothetical protein
MAKQGNIMKDFFNKIFMKIDLPIFIVPGLHIDNLNIESIMSRYSNGKETLLSDDSENIWLDQNAIFFENEVISFDTVDQILKKYGIPNGMNSCKKQPAIKLGEITSLGRVKTTYKRFRFSDTESPFYVGKCVIDLSRIVDAVIYHNTNKWGFSWPKAITPFKVLLLCSPDKIEHATSIYMKLIKSGISVLLDDRAIPLTEKIEWSEYFGVYEMFNVDDIECANDIIHSLSDI